MGRIQVSNMNQLSILLVNYPFSNQTEFKTRPAVVISNNEFNKKHRYCLTCPITSKESLKEFELELEKNDFDGNLNKKSFIRSDSIASIEKSLIVRKIGQINLQLFERLKKKIIENL